MKPLRYPTSIEEALADTLESIIDPTFDVTITKQVMAEMLQLLVKLKHS